MRVLAVLGIFGQAFFVAVVALLPFFQPGYSSADDPISRLLIGPYGFVLSGALFAAGLGSLALALGIRRTTRGTRGSLFGPLLIGLWALGFALAGVVWTDAEGSLTEAARAFHRTVVSMSLGSAIAGMLVLSRTFARESRWRPFYPVSLALGFAAVVELINMTVVSAGIAGLAETLGPVARSFGGFGIIQRMLVGTIILWMLLAAIRLPSIAKSGRSSPSKEDEFPRSAYSRKPSFRVGPFSRQFDE